MDYYGWRVNKNLLSQTDINAQAWVINQYLKTNKRTTIKCCSEYSYEDITDYVYKGVEIVDEWIRELGCNG
ncbi:MAG: hypothetical protein EBW40_10380 [Gammaproteobacteria bacterium]|nr:hypothetical protein [Gammaproteobacteria bacterium]